MRMPYRSRLGSAAFLLCVAVFVVGVVIGLTTSVAGLVVAAAAVVAIMLINLRFADRSERGS